VLRVRDRARRRGINGDGGLLQTSRVGVPTAKAEEGSSVAGARRTAGQGEGVATGWHEWQKWEKTEVATFRRTSGLVEVRHDVVASRGRRLVAVQGEPQRWCRRSAQAW